MAYWRIPGSQNTIGPSIGAESCGPLFVVAVHGVCVQKTHFRSRGDIGPDLADDAPGAAGRIAADAMLHGLLRSELSAARKFACSPSCRKSGHCRIWWGLRRQVVGLCNPWRIDALFPERLHD